jgi:hypothetical protein
VSGLEVSRNKNKNKNKIKYKYIWGEEISCFTDVHSSCYDEEMQQFIVTVKKR